MDTEDQGGRPSAERLFEENLGLAYYMAGRYTASGLLSREEIVAEALDALWQAANRYDADSSSVRFSTFACGAIRSQVGRTFNRRRRQLQVEPPVESIELFASPAGQTEAAALASLEAAAVAAALQAIPERDRRVVVAVFWEGQTQAEVARQQGVTRNRVHFILNRGLDSLRRTLSSEAAHVQDSEGLRRDCRVPGEADSYPAVTNRGPSA